jgi:AraC-like DNA-binding protein
MRALRYKPEPRLAKFVDCLWYFEGSRATRELALPTGTAELVINVRDNFIRVCSRVDDFEGEAFAGAVVSGAQSRYMVLPACPEGSVMGVHFRPGGAGPFLGLPLSELADRHVALEDLWGRQAHEIREQLCEAKSPTAALALLERALLSRLADRALCHPAVAFALERFAAAPSVARVREVAEASGYSAKRFIRLFTEGVGLSPKRFCRILRLQAVLNQLASGGRVEWAEFALGSGYYDQSHLIREFRAMTGLTPAQYRPVEPDTPNHVAIED